VKITIFGQGETQQPFHRLVGADGAARHLQVREHHVGRKLGDDGHGLLVVGRLAHDLDVGGEREHLDHAPPEQLVVVADHHPYDARRDARLRHLANPPLLPWCPLRETRVLEAMPRHCAVGGPPSARSRWPL
jgi:hypothetical protein